MSSGRRLSPPSLSERGVRSPPGLRLPDDCARDLGLRHLGLFFFCCFVSESLAIISAFRAADLALARSAMVRRRRAAAAADLFCFVLSAFEFQGIWDSFSKRT